MAYDWSFSTSAAGQGADKFRILAFTGEDSVCQGYRFDILLLADVTESDAPAFLKNMAEAESHTLRGGTDATGAFAWSGMPERVEGMFSATGGGSVIRALLRPHSFKLRLGARSRVFLGAAVPALLQYLLVQEGFTTDTDFTTADLRQTYKARSASCQYNESSFNFLLRHLERVGGYSYIEQNNGKDRLVLADGAAEVPALPGQSDLDWDPTRAMPITVYSFSRSMATGPTSVTLRDYSTEKPGTESKTETPQPVTIDDVPYAPLRGGGTANWYGMFNMFGETNPDAYSAADAQAQALLMAQARARSLVSQSNLIRGESTVAWMRAGYSFTLSQKNYQLLTVRCACNCCQNDNDRTNVSRAANLGFTFDLSRAGYYNSFVCHSLELGPFAPELSAPRPAVNGLVHATVCSPASAGGYASLDDKGRYRARFHFPEAVFDANNNPVTDDDAGLPVPLRAMQTHAGAASGIHFPLLKDAEVLVAFTDGDPDRPVILGSLPNPANPSVVTDANNKENIVKTPQGHSLIIKDDAGSNRQITLTSAQGHALLMKDDVVRREILLSSADTGNYIRIIELSETDKQGR
ncbi:MAG: type VI secretion system Vgr family protein [Desulfovibrio sp.]|jgi:type VI secretion system secreted protein VgrG|nr:type VI secretion system Vgr family protein [Desulfovibrio sp.]